MRPGTATGLSQQLQHGRAEGAAHSASNAPTHRAAHVRRYTSGEWFVEPLAPTGTAFCPTNAAFGSMVAAMGLPPSVKGASGFFSNWSVHSNYLRLLRAITAHIVVPLNATNGAVRVPPCTPTRRLLDGRPRAASRLYARQLVADGQCRQAHLLVCARQALSPLYLLCPPKWFQPQPPARRGGPVR